MKALTLTSSLIAALTLATFAESDSSLRSRISLKEKELAELQNELASLRSRLSSPSSTSYSVKTGDTISSIARRYGVSAADLMAWNKITDPTRLGIGQVLTIQEANTDVSEAPKAIRVNSPVPAPATDYTIVSGDTFYSIARAHKLTVTRLRDLNPDVSTHLITAGQKLRISGTPATSPDKTPARIATKPPVVQKKETNTTEVAPPVIKAVTETIETKTSKKSLATPPPVLIAESPAPPPPPAPPVVKEEKAPSKTSVASIILTDETTFEAFATKHGTNTEQLNALNGWNLPSATVLARGSEIYVPR